MQYSQQHILYYYTMACVTLFHPLLIPTWEQRRITVIYEYQARIQHPQKPWLRKFIVNNERKSLSSKISSIHPFSSLFQTRLKKGCWEKQIPATCTASLKTPDYENLFSNMEKKIKLQNKLNSTFFTPFQPPFTIKEELL